MSTAARPRGYGAIVAMFRHRGYRDAQNGVPLDRVPAADERYQRAWREGWWWALSDG